MSTPKRSIHVMAAVISDARGRILLARRDGTSDLQGLWEFPGGKREPGEACEDALVRELQEELDITVEVGEPLIQVPQHYPNKYLRLDVRHVRAWQGKPKGHEGQALTWVAPDKLPRYSMPPADLPVVAALLQPEHYWQLSLPRAGDEAGLEAIRNRVAQGARRICLRLPAQRGADDAASLGQVIALSAEVQWLVEGDVELARTLGIGLQLRPEQLAQPGERPLAAGQLLAARCETLEHIIRAQALGCDFVEVTLQPGKPQGCHDWDGFETLREETALPIYLRSEAAGIEVAKARAHGAQGLVVTDG